MGSFVVCLLSEIMRPKLTPITFEIAESSSRPNRLVLHQFVLEVASATQGFNHSALMDNIKANIALAEDLILYEPTLLAQNLLLG